MQTDICYTVHISYFKNNAHNFKLMKKNVVWRQRDSEDGWMLMWRFKQRRNWQKALNYNKKKNILQISHQQVGRWRFSLSESFWQEVMTVTLFEMRQSNREGCSESNISDFYTGFVCVRIHSTLYPLHCKLFTTKYFFCRCNISKTQFCS
jgi:hypothetical protein